MTAYDLIESIFRRGQLGLPGNQRRITADQFRYLRDLIGADEEGAAVCSNADGSLTWAPSGRNKYVIAPPPPGKKMGLLTRFSNLVPSGMGRLF